MSALSMAQALTKFIDTNKKHEMSSWSEFTEIDVTIATSCFFLRNRLKNMSKFHVFISFSCFDYFWVIFGGFLRFWGNQKIQDGHYFENVT